ncbi:MAG: AAA domain-containing protein, partial [Candidatus Methylomirabilaceae bacterium]
MGKDLLRALEARDVDGYHEAFSRAFQNQQRAKSQERRESLLSKLRDGAPLLAEQLASTARDASWDQRAAQFAPAWNWARAIAWIERLCDPEAEQQLRLQLDSARDRIRDRLKEIAAEKAWSHCFARMTEHERQHLVAWSKAVRSIGKGTGKYAPMHRRNAREHLNECRSAIPAWVMPLYRVAETIKPGNDLFDVVIIDEASQSGPEALLLAYLAKKLVVVGDDKQISPTYAGIDHEDVNQLRARHLADLPHADSYGVQQSFFDLAEIRYQGRIRLREHFRCMPEIIQFSNNLCYQSEPLIPLRQYGGSRLSPVVLVRHVAKGYLKGSGQSVINPPEAQAIVDTVLRLHADAAYEQKTFGIISLLGDSQAREIERLLLEKMGPREMEHRQLVCGDAYAFQGDERDVMLLSLVSAPSEGRRIGTLSDEAARRRFNVAASRARDQLFLFHTATLNDLSSQCLRYALLSYCQNPAVERSEVSSLSVADLQHLAATADRGRLRAPEPFGSWFEVDVFLRLVARGYRVLPQCELAGYR